MTCCFVPYSTIVTDLQERSTVVSATPVDVTEATSPTGFRGSDRKNRPTPEGRAGNWRYLESGGGYVRVQFVDL